MKTSDEWAKHFKLHSCIGNKKFESQIKQIQLDAYKSGMIEAAEICKYHTNNACETGFASQFDCQQAILSARDRKESL